MSFNSPAAAVGCYSTGEEIANSVTHGVAALLSIAGLVVMLSMMPVTAGAATITAAAGFDALPCHPEPPRQAHSAGA